MAMHSFRVHGSRRPAHRLPGAAGAAWRAARRAARCGPRSCGTLRPSAHAVRPSGSPQPGRSLGAEPATAAGARRGAGRRLREGRCRSSKGRLVVQHHAVQTCLAATDRPPSMRRPPHLRARAHQSGLALPPGRPPLPPRLPTSRRLPPPPPQRPRCATRRRRCRWAAPGSSNPASLPPGPPGAAPHRC